MTEQTKLRHLAGCGSGNMTSDNVSCSHQTEFNLIKVKGTWIRQTEACQEDEGKLSDAKIYESKLEDGVSWTVVSPIVFTYRVIQCKNILDPRNDTLLWGHLGDEGLKGSSSNSKPVKRFVVIDETVNQLYGSRVTQYFEAREVVYKILPLPTTEENKCMELVTRILEAVHEFGIDRRTEPIIAIGGGVCLDVVGLAASLYRRRTPYVRVPTTLLSYIDASVGAKTGVNFSGGKNKLGSYVPPAATFLDCSFFRSLPPRQISNGLAEMLKVFLSA